MPYNPISLDIDNSFEGAKLKHKTNIMRYHHDMRRSYLQKMSMGEFNPITGLCLCWASLSCANSRALFTARLDRPPHSSPSARPGAPTPVKQVVRPSTPDALRTHVKNVQSQHGEINKGGSGHNLW